MKASFREVLYAPNFVSSFRVVLGALVQADGRVTFVPARWLPDAATVGGEAPAALMHHELRQLGRKRLTSLHTLVDITGPCVVLGDQRDLSVVDDPIEWVREHVVPQSRAAA